MQVWAEMRLMNCSHSISVVRTSPTENNLLAGSSMLSVIITCASLPKPVSKWWQKWKMHYNAMCCRQGVCEGLFPGVISRPPPWILALGLKTDLSPEPMPTSTLVFFVVLLCRECASVEMCFIPAWIHQMLKGSLHMANHPGQRNTPKIWGERAAWNNWNTELANKKVSSWAVDSHTCLQSQQNRAKVDRKMEKLNHTLSIDQV